MILSRETAKKYVSQPPFVATTWDEDGDTQDIINCIRSQDKDEAKERFCQRLAIILRGSTDEETCSNIYYSVANWLQYATDPRGWERIRSSRNTIWHGEADCKSYSILIVSFLRECGIDAIYRFVAWKKGEDYTHVYPIAILANGKKIIMDAIPDAYGFNKEAPFDRKTDCKMTKISKIDGIAPHATTHTTQQPVRGSGNAAQTNRRIFIEGGDYNAAPSNLTLPSLTDIPFENITEGETMVGIIRDRLKMFLAVHPNNPLAPMWARFSSIYDNALFYGLHNWTPITGNFYTRAEQDLMKILVIAKKRTKPAFGKTHVLNGRPTIGHGIKNGGIWGEPDANTKAKWESECLEEVYTRFGDDKRDRKNWNDGITQFFNACKNEKLQGWGMSFQIMEGAPHLFTYNFVTEAQLQVMTEAQKIRKLASHNTVMGAIGSATQLSTTNLKLLTDNACMAKFATNGRGMISQETTLDILMANPSVSLLSVKDNPSVSEIKGGIGDFGISSAIAVCTIIFAGSIGVVAIIQAANGQEPTSLRYIKDVANFVIGADGKSVHLPEGPDFKANVNACPQGYQKNTAGACELVEKKDNGGNGGSSSLLVPVLIGGAVIGGAYYLMSDKKKK